MCVCVENHRKCGVELTDVGNTDWVSSVDLLTVCNFFFHNLLLPSACQQLTE